MVHRQRLVFEILGNLCRIRNNEADVMLMRLAVLANVESIVVDFCSLHCCTGYFGVRAFKFGAKLQLNKYWHKYIQSICSWCRESNDKDKVRASHLLLRKEEGWHGVLVVLRVMK